MNKNYNKDTLLTTILAYKHDTLANLNCVKMGKIVSYENNWAQCEITHKRTVGLNEDGSQIVKSYPPIYARVVFWGNAKTGQNHPIKENMPCILLFSDREYNSYYQSGEVSPLADYRMHDLSDAICIPIIWGESGGEDYNIFSDKNIKIKTELGSKIELSEKVSIKNNAQSLSILINSLISSVQSIVTVAGGPLKPESIQSLEQVKTLFNELIE